MIELKSFGSREEWLEERKGTIGGSDAGVILGLNQYKTNVDLWEEMTGRRIAPDVSSSPAVEFGRFAEEPIRRLFELEHPEFTVAHNDNSFYVNDAFPFAHASLDGELIDIQKNSFGVLEIKTGTITSSMMRKKWENRVPDTYYAQICFYLGVTGFSFAVLRAHLRMYGWSEDREYRFNRDEVMEQDIQLVMDSCEEFYEAVKEDRRPGLILPELR